MAGITAPIEMPEYERNIMNISEPRMKTGNIRW
jgi:hypothetical protein